MKEKIKHKEAFEYYLSLGNDRSHKKVAEQFVVSAQTITKWSQAFNWAERVVQREIDIAKLIEKKINRTIADTKADYRAEIKNSLDLLKKILVKCNERWNAGEQIFKINTMADLAKVSSEVERMMKLDLLLMGEDLDNKELKIKVTLED